MQQFLDKLLEVVNLVNSYAADYILVFLLVCRSAISLHGLLYALLGGCPDQRSTTIDAIGFCFGVVFATVGTNHDGFSFS